MGKAKGLDQEVNILARFFLFYLATRLSSTEAMTVNYMNMFPDLQMCSLVCYVTDNGTHLQILKHIGVVEQK